MHQQEIKVFVLGQTALNRDQVKAWLRENGAYEYEPEHGTDTEVLIGLAGKRCYRSFEIGLNPNVTRVRSAWADYITHILKSGHGSVLEHATYTFGIEGVTRVFTGEMNRHRAGVAISEGSMRYIRFDDIPFWMPKSLEYTEDEEKFLSQKWNDLGIEFDGILVVKGKETYEELLHSTYVKGKEREILFDVFNYVEEKYIQLCEIHAIETLPMHEKKQLTSRFRRIIPMGVSTGGVWTLNIRALRHVITMRSAPEAEEEIALVASLMAKEMISRECNLFGDFEEQDGYWVPKYRKV